MWRVVIWLTQNECLTQEFDSREASYPFVHSHLDAVAVEVYGPDGYYDAN